jgi:NAD(P)-dependent dehydrogenase (short-subunit alcohol dehydrogenase family)
VRKANSTTAFQFWKAQARARRHSSLRRRNYHYSKLANVLFTQEFNLRVHAAGGVTAFVLHPGVIDTGLGRHGGMTNLILYKVRCCRFGIESNRRALV